MWKFDFYCTRTMVYFYFGLNNTSMLIQFDQKSSQIHQRTIKKAICIFTLKNTIKLSQSFFYDWNKWWFKKEPWSLDAKTLTMKSDLCSGSLFRFGIKPICITYTDTDRILIVFTKQIKSPQELKRKSKAHLLLSLILPYPQLFQLKDLLNMGNTYCHLRYSQYGQYSGKKSFSDRVINSSCTTLWIK